MGTRKIEFLDLLTKIEVDGDGGYVPVCTAGFSILGNAIFRREAKTKCSLLLHFTYPE
jgi:hypothetical protein